LGIAELTGASCVTIGKKVEIGEGRVVVERIVPEGHEVVEAPLPAVVTVSNELGQPRYPTLRGIMAATRKQATVWSADDLGVAPSEMRPMLNLVDLFVPSTVQECDIIEGDTEEEAGRNLALKLREAKLI
jgi:electron transfer flavoprotein beta subunit